MASIYDDDYNIPANETLAYQVSDAVLTDSPTFDIVFEGVCTFLFWVLLIVYGGLGLKLYIKEQASQLKRWPLYLMLMAYIILGTLSTTIALGFTVSARRGYESDGAYLAYTFFYHASTGAFLLLLLALSSGYCITRGDLSGHEVKVFVIPAIIFVAGVAADWTFWYVEDSQHLSAAADRYNLLQMSKFETVVWIVGMLANLMAFIMAWIVVFDSTKIEIDQLDNMRQAALEGHQQGQDSDSDASDNEDREHRKRRQRSLQTTSTRAGLLYGMEESSSTRGGQGRDEEQATQPQAETFADVLEYTVRKQLLTRFYYAVCTYLTTAILTMLLPAYFNVNAQNTIIVVEFAVKYAFTLLLAWFFRPSRDSPYLQIGLTESDQAGMLDTELAVTEYQADPSFANGIAPAGPSSTREQGRSNSSSTRPNQTGTASGGTRQGFGPAPQLPVSLSAQEAASSPKKNGTQSSLPKTDVQLNSKQKSRFTIDEDEV